MTINELNQAIMFGEFTNEQLDSIQMSIKFARAKLGRKNKGAFGVGDTVRFDSRGVRYVGIVQRVLVKNVVVKTSLGVYRVPANMLVEA